MRLLLRRILSDPFKAGAKVLQDEEVVKILQGSKTTEQVVAPYAKTLGYVLHPPKPSHVIKPARVKRKKNANRKTHVAKRRS